MNVLTRNKLKTIKNGERKGEPIFVQMNAWVLIWLWGVGGWHD